MQICSTFSFHCEEIESETSREPELSPCCSSKTVQIVTCVEHFSSITRALASYYVVKRHVTVIIKIYVKDTAYIVIKYINVLAAVLNTETDIST